MISKKCTVAILLAAVLALSLLLTACGNGGTMPTGDNSTPGVTDTETPSSTLDTATSTPDEALTTPNAAPTPNGQEPETEAVIPVADTQNNYDF